ncbi:general substrate transporter [Chiua virens]|nr:general substrate transporter [Chiua virens]
MTSNWGWRIPCLLQVVFSLLQVTFIWFLPESPRWLVAKGRGDEAYAILVKYHAEGNGNSDFVKAEYSQIENTLEAELKIAQINQRVSFSAPGMRRRIVLAAFLGLCVPWSGMDLISYYLAPILDNIGIHDYRTKHIVNIARFSWSLVTGITASLVAPQYPRRRIFLSCTIAIFFVFTAWTAASAEYSFTHSKVSALLVLALIFLYIVAYNLAFGVLPYCYLAELFPFHARAQGVSVYQWSMRSAAFVNQFANSIGMDAFGTSHPRSSSDFVVIVYLMFPETSGRTLEELTFLYEDEQNGYRDA